MRRFPQAYCVFEAGGCSDHQRCRISITADQLKPKRPFKFTNAVADMPEFLPLVKSFWDETVPLHISTSALFRLGKKLKSLKPLLRKLSKDKIGDIVKKTKEAYIKLCAAQTQTLTDPTQLNMEEETSARERWQFLSDLEEKILSQKAKLHWLNIGDGNNKQFHCAARVRETRNAIREIQRSDGTVADNQEDIKKEAVSHFSSFLSYEPADYRGVTMEDMQSLLDFRCSEEMRSSMVREVSAEEIRKVIFGMARNKSPGPDGYTYEFFKAAWPVVGGDLVMAIRSFFENGFLPKGLNSTILALIPKKEVALHMRDYRPISCCNVVYKVISKILARRLKSLLPSFISKNQSAFVKDRLLMENVLLASELVKSYHKTSVSTRCAVQIDISKAFDSVQWPFLLTALSALNIPERFVLWI